MNQFKFKFRLIITIAILLTAIFLLGQTMAVFNYDFTVSIGLQESAEAVTEVGVALNKGFGLGDTLVYIPLMVFGIIGMVKRQFWGLICMSGALAITVYWPVVCLSTLFYAKDAAGFGFSAYTEYTILLTVIALYGLWGLLFIFRNHNSIIDK